MSPVPQRWVVVGGGSAGCAVTRRLVDAGHDVTLIESGPPLAPGQLPLGVASDNCFAALEPDRVQTGLVATRTQGRPATPYLRGRGIGGSSAVNAMVALDGDAELYRSWGWDDVDAARRRVLLPANVADDEELGAVDRALLAAAADARRAPLNRRDGRRVTSAEAYLWPIDDSDRLTIRTDALVDRVLIDDRRAATGVLLADGEVVDADHVVVSAGAIHSPAILLRSELGVDGIGEGLQDHPACAFTLELEQPPDTLGLAAATLIDRDPIQILALNHLGLVGGPGLVMVSHMRPRSATGSVRLASADPFEHPVVDFDLLSDPDDLAVLRAGVRDALALLAHPAFRSIVRQIYIDDVGTTAEALHDDASIDAWLLARSADYVHASSSCAMGRVVDSDGRVMNTTGLHVCDASVFPTIPNVNTHLPTTMLAERLVARWT